MTEARPDARPDAEVVELCRELIRIDTSNYGDQDGPGERREAQGESPYCGAAGGTCGAGHHDRRTTTEPRGH